MVHETPDDMIKTRHRKVKTQHSNQMDGVQGIIKQWRYSDRNVNWFKISTLWLDIEKQR